MSRINWAQVEGRSRFETESILPELFREDLLFLITEVDDETHDAGCDGDDVPW